MKERKLTGMESMNEIWNDIFLNAIYYGRVYVKSGRIHMELNGTDTTMSAKNFKLAFQETFYKAYRENLYPAFELNTLSVEQVESICIWLNPVLSDLKIDGFEEYKKRLEDRFTEGGKNYNVSTANIFKMQLRNMLFNTPPEKRKQYINYILPYKILSFSDLVELEYYTDIPRDDEINKYKKENGEFSEDDSQALAKLSIRRLSNLKNYKYKVSKNKIKNYSQYVPSDILINMAEFGEIPYEYLEYANLSKADILSVKHEVLVSVLENRDKYPKKLRITSQDIIDAYGIFLNGARFYKLVMYGYVDSKQVIDIINKNKILKLSGEPSDNLFGDEEVLAFYSSDKILEMFFDGKIDSEFITKYKSALGNDELFEKKSEVVIEQIKFKIMTNSKISVDKKDDIVQGKIVEAYKLGLCTPEVLKQNISPEYLEKQYLEGNISDVNILNLYKSGIVGFDLIKNYFSEKEIFDLYLKGDISIEVISTLRDTNERNEEILEAVMNEKMSLSDVLYLYLNNNLTVEELEDAIEFSQTEFDISTCIDENTDFTKIKEMFERKIIDYSCVTSLHDIGILSKEQLEELKQTMDKEKFFDNLKGKTFKLVTDREARTRVLRGKKTGTGGTNPISDKSNRYSKEKELISKILGLENLEENLQEYATIESYNQKGKPTSLDGYKVFGSKDNGLVIFAKFQKENAVFVMPFYQAAYFLNTRGKDNISDVIIEDRMKDKAYLKTLSQVEVIPHTEYFARNLSLAANRLSSEYKEKFDMDKKYQLEVRKLCNEMRSDYRIQKGLDEK